MAAVLAAGKMICTATAVTMKVCYVTVHIGALCLVGAREIVESEKIQVIVPRKYTPMTDSKLVGPVADVITDNLLLNEILSDNQITQVYTRGKIPDSPIRIVQEVDTHDEKNFRLSLMALWALNKTRDIRRDMGVQKLLAEKANNSIVEYTMTQRFYQQQSNRAENHQVSYIYKIISKNPGAFLNMVAPNSK